MTDTNAISNEGEARVDSERKRFESLTRLWTWHRLHLLLMGEGATATMDDSHHSVADSRPPKPVGHELRALEDRWEECVDNDERAVVIRDTQRLHDQLKFPKADPRTIRDTEDWRRAIGVDERSANEVARYYGTSRRTVYRCRAEFKDERSKLAA